MAASRIRLASGCRDSPKAGRWTYLGLQVNKQYLLCLNYRSTTHSWLLGAPRIVEVDAVLTPFQVWRELCQFPTYVTAYRQMDTDTDVRAGRQQDKLSCTKSTSTQWRDLYSLWLMWGHSQRCFSAQELWVLGKNEGVQPDTFCKCSSVMLAAQPL